MRGSTEVSCNRRKRNDSSRNLDRNRYRRGHVHRAYQRRRLKKASPATRRYEKRGLFLLVRKQTTYAPVYPTRGTDQAQTPSPSDSLIRVHIAFRRIRSAAWCRKRSASKHTR